MISDTVSTTDMENRLYELLNANLRGLIQIEVHLYTPTVDNVETPIFRFTLPSGREIAFSGPIETAEMKIKALNRVPAHMIALVTDVEFEWQYIEME